jgi:SAM-dependent methyltransferase
MTTGQVVMQKREKAEIARSSDEASRTTDAALRLSPRHEARYVAPSGETAYPLEYAYHLIGNVAGQRVVDFGCGSGPNTVLLANRGAQVWGIDISEDLIRVAQRRLAVNGRAGKAQFIVASAHDLPFRDQSIDVVFGNAILHHVDLALVAKEVHRVLRPGGRAIFKEPVRNSPALRFVRRLIPYQAAHVSPFERPLTDEELRAFARPFARVRTRAFCLPHVLVGARLLGNRPQDTLYESDAAALRWMPALEYYAGIRVIEVTRG